MPAFVVRAATGADRAVLLSHVLELNRFEDRLAGDRATGPADAAPTLDQVLGRVAATGGAALVAEAEGQVIGHLFLAIETAPPYVRAALRRRAWVADAFVQTPWRGRGAFRALLAEADAFARRAGCAQLLIGVLAGNDRAERVYRQAGFRTYAIELIRDLGP